jgi:hypothetical protein
MDQGWGEGADFGRSLALVGWAVDRGDEVDGIVVVYHLVMEKGRLSLLNLTN